jgi:cytoskeletal protein CcmA (bactofilin family)
MVASVSTPASAPCNIGPRISVRGTLAGEEDLIVEGRVEGSIALTGHLAVAEAGVVEADIEVDSVDVYGQVEGDILAATAITLHESARVSGNLRAPRVVIADGAQFKGTVEMDVQLPGSLSRQPRR